MIIKTIEILRCPKCNKVFKMAIDCLESSRQFFANEMKKELQKTLKTHLNKCKE